MANQKVARSAKRPIVPILITFTAVTVVFCILSTPSSGVPELVKTSFSPLPKTPVKNKLDGDSLEKYLYWGSRIDCPGKHCDTCAGLGHQESSLRCALEEALYLQRTFVMPSRMCINPMHNKKGILDRSDNQTSEATWAGSSCAMDSLYDLSLISKTVPVVLDNSKAWYRVVATSMNLGERGVANVKSLSRDELKREDRYSKLLLINRTASPLAWFAECKDRHNPGAIMLPYSFLPSMAAKKLRNAAEKIRLLLGDYDAMHVRRGDILKTRKDRFGVARTLHPHLDRDTR
uniref:O-fucosyltransferase family protein n=1 Tax=Kalanchoe fedtschenkoi TaxID=63787 RepID=A0A7N0T7Y7_KALFE